MTSNAVTNVMALFDAVEIDWGDIGISNKPCNEAIKISEKGVTLAFQPNESSETEYQRIKVHRERKRGLGHRLVVLRNYIKRCYGNKWINDAAHWNELEDWLDCALKENDYDLEKAIDYYRSIVPEPKITLAQCIKCGYCHPFCRCR